MGKSKSKVIGTQHYLNPNTGELIDMQVIETEESDKDFNFHKLFMKNFLASLDIVSNQKTKVAYWIIEHINKDNMLIYSYRQIADATGISYQTVATTVKILLDADFLRKNGKVIIVNPDIIFKGSASRRANILHTYKRSETGDATTNDELRIETLETTIQSLTKELNKLKSKRLNVTTSETA